MDTPEDLDFLKQLETTEPDFFLEYTGGTTPMSTSSNDSFLSVKDCATDLGVCKNSILNYIKSGKMNASFADNQWQIKESDFLDFKSSFTIIRGDKRSRLISDDAVSSRPASKKKSSLRRTPPQTGLVTDFLHSWPKNGSAGFHLSTICRDYNRISEHKLNEEQMSGVLSALARKGIVIRKGKGTYQVSPSISSSGNHQVVVEGITPPAESSRFHSKKDERVAVENFVAQNAKPGVDFSFTISELARAYPQMDRRKLCKACSNMYQGGKLTRGSGIGDYIKPAKISWPAVNRSMVQTKPTVESKELDSMDKIKQIMDLDISKEFKLEIMKKFLS